MTRYAVIFFRAVASGNAVVRQEPQVFGCPDRGNPGRPVPHAWLFSSREKAEAFARAKGDAMGGDGVVFEEVA